MEVEMRRSRILVLAGVPAALVVGLAPTAFGTTGETSMQAPAAVAPAAVAPAAVAPAAVAPLIRPAIFGPAVTVPPGENLLATVSCPVGATPVGGGGDTTGIRTFLTASFSSGQTWNVRGTNTGTMASTLRAYVLCVQLYS